MMRKTELVAEREKLKKKMLWTARGPVTKFSSTRGRFFLILAHSPKVKDAFYVISISRKIKLKKPV